MKRAVSSFALVLLLCACTPAAGTEAPSAVTPEAAATGESAGTAATPEQAAALPAGLEDAGLPVLDYEEIRLVYHVTPLGEPSTGYYTMCRDGRWGLMRGDGSVLIDCVSEQPVIRCQERDIPRWGVYGLDQDAQAEIDRYLAAAGGGRLCAGDHCGPGYEEYFWLPDRSQMCAYIGSMGPSTPTYISPQMQENEGYWFPCRPATLTEEDWGLTLSYDPQAPYRYRSTEGLPLNNYEYQQAGTFRNGALLAAARRGEKWLYLDGSGNEVTAPVYDPVYRAPGDGTGYAAPLLNGYAAVSREGKFGLLDSAGAEFVPCAYDGLVWDGFLGWVKLADGWHGFTVPSAPVEELYPDPQPDPLGRVPLTMVFPDTWPGNGRRTAYTTIRDDNLNIRSGPGTEYDKIGSFPPGTPVTELGTSSTVGGWTFVCQAYQNDGYGLTGWVSSEYLE